MKTFLIKVPAVTRRTAVIVAATAVIAGGGSAAALASSNSPGTVFHGCLSQVGGLMYGVTTNPGQQPRCRVRDQQVSWNQTGPQGPQGPAGEVSGLYWRGANGTLPPKNGHLRGELTCESGDEVYAGGAVVENSNGQQPITEDGPSGDMTGWDAEAWNFDPNNSYTFDLYALCGPKFS